MTQKTIYKMSLSIGLICRKLQTRGISDISCTKYIGLCCKPRIKQQENANFNIYRYIKRNHIESQQILHPYSNNELNNLTKFDITAFDFYCKNDLSTLQWENIIKNDLIDTRNRPIKKEIFESNLFKVCFDNNKVDLALSYDNYCKGNGSKLNFVARSYFLLLIANNISVIGEDKFKENYDVLKMEKFLPCEIICRMIAAVSLTTYWKESFKLMSTVLEEETNFIRHSLLIKRAYNYIARSLLREKGFDKGVAYLKEEYFCSEQRIDHDTWLLTLSIMKNRKYEDFKIFCDLLLQCNASLNVSIIHSIKNTLPEGWTSEYVRIAKRHKCSNCGVYLKKVTLTTEDLVRLKKACESAVICKEDIFQTTTPQEWKSFQIFLQKHSPFDTILDGLNLLLSRDKRSQVYLRKILESPKKKFLMVLRRHALEDVKKIFKGKALPKNLFLYFLNNYTKDDGFLLYAAFYSGLGTKLITRDFLRNHRFLMKDPELIKCFDNWQKLYQVRWVSEEGIYQYDRVPQWSDDGNSFHIPLEVPTEENFYFTNKIDWLCIRTKEIK